jgi:signal transduction histidine kinase
LAVKDNGIGIPDDDKPFLFERFFRAHNAGNAQGTGLGLNIVKRYVELMGGEIEYTSELGVGSEFRVIFYPDTFPT